MKWPAHPVVGVPVGRQRDWIPVTTLAVPTVWMATADGLVCLDLIAVELAVNGLRKGWTLASHEAAYAADFMLQRGVDHAVIAHRIGVSGETFRKWFPSDDTPLPEALAQIRTRSEAAHLGAATRGDRVRCGTYWGSKRHWRRNEQQCEACKEARRLAHRYYRKHGTYVGAPEVSA